MKTTLKSSIFHTFKGDATPAQLAMTFVMIAVPVLTVIVLVFKHVAN